MICAFTGHRPSHLPWGRDESDPRCLALRSLIRDTARRSAEEGYTDFLCGMARGCDLYFAEEVLHLRDAEELPIRLIAMIPCPGQADRWSGAEQERYRVLCSRCDETLTLEPIYSSGCMLRRNRAMVQKAQRLITVFDGTNGGTAAAIRYAKQLGVEIVSIWY